jgi:hypothetical protein
MRHRASGSRGSGPPVGILRLRAHAVQRCSRRRWRPRPGWWSCGERTTQPVVAEPTGRSLDRGRGSATKCRSLDNVMPRQGPTGCSSTRTRIPRRRRPGRPQSVHQSHQVPPLAPSCVALAARSRGTEHLRRSAAADQQGPQHEAKRTQTDHGIEGQKKDPRESGGLS